MSGPIHQQEFSLSVTPSELQNMRPVSKGLITDLWLHPLNTGQKLPFNGDAHKVTVMQIQLYKQGEKGIVRPHCEDEGVTEIYFPIHGKVKIFLEDSPESDRMKRLENMEGQFSAEISSTQIRITLKSDGNNISCLINGEEVSPVILPAGLKHSTQHVSRNTDSAVEDAMWLALKIQKQA